MCLECVWFSSKNSIVRVAFGANQMVTAETLVLRLQNNVLLLVNALLANTVRGFVALLIFLQTKDEDAVFPFVQLVSRKLIFNSFKLLRLNQKVMQLALKIDVRQLRLRQLVGKFNQGRFDIRVATCLRVANKFADGGYTGDQLRYAFGRLSSHSEGALHSLKIKIHKFTQSQSESHQRLTDAFNNLKGENQ